MIFLSAEMRGGCQFTNTHYLGTYIQSRNLLLLKGKEQCLAESLPPSSWGAREPG